MIKIGDTFEFATRKLGHLIHEESVPCVVLKTDSFYNGEHFHCSKCNECGSITSHFPISCFDYCESNIYQILVGNKKIIIAIDKNKAYPYECPGNIIK